MILERFTPWMIVAIAIAALSMTLSAELLFKVEPCILCLYQRLPYVATGLLALLALKQSPGAITIPLIVGVCAVVYLGGAGIAVYHIGVEQHWWISACTGVTAGDISFDNLRSALSSRSEKPCDDINWTLFGVSMATYNAAFSAAMALLSFMAAYRIWKNHEPKKTNP